MEILFEIGDLYVYKAEPWDLQAFEGDTYVVNAIIDGVGSVIAEFETLEEAEDYAQEVYAEMTDLPN
jgi:hypothetical protein